MLNYEQELILEEKYQGVLQYVDAKQFLDNTPYTAAKINGAIKRFCNAEGAEKPTTFTEMESFVSDLVDFWLDTNPEVHSEGEDMLHNAASNYLAFSTVWKAKSKSLKILNSRLMAKVGAMIVFKNSLGQAVKICNSCAKRNPLLNREELSEGFINGFAAILPIVSNLERLPEPPEELTRLVGAYMAGNKEVLQIAETLTPRLEEAV